MRTRSAVKVVPPTRSVQDAPTRTARGFLAGLQHEPAPVREQLSYWRAQFHALPQAEPGASHYDICGSYDTTYRFPCLEALFALQRLHLGAESPRFAEHCGGTIPYVLLSAMRAGFQELTGYEPNGPSRYLQSEFFAKPRLRVELAGRHVTFRLPGEYTPAHVVCWSMPWPGLVETPAHGDVFD